MRKVRLMAAAVLLGGALLSGCSATQVKNTWKDPSVESKSFQKTLVVSLVPDEAVRRNLENEVSARLANSGVTAVPGNKYFEEGAKVDKEAVKGVVQEQGFDSVLVLNYLGTEKSMQYVPGTYDAYVGVMRPMIYEPGYMEERREAKLQTKLFDAEQGGKMVWSASTSTFNPTSTEQGIASVAKKVVEQLEKDVRI